VDDVGRRPCHLAAIVGTYGGGLFCLQHGKVSAITTKDGLPDDVVPLVLGGNALQVYSGLDPA